MKNVGHQFANFWKIFLAVIVFVLGIGEVKGQQGGRCISGDCQNGYGVYLYANGNRYEGEFKRGLSNGKGKINYSKELKESYPNGELSYEGTFSDGHLGRIGTIIYRNGDKFIVYDHVDIYQIGEYFYANGERYKGSRSRVHGDNKREGMGKTYSKDNIIIEEGYYFDDSWIADSEEDAKSQDLMTKKSYENLIKKHNGLPEYATNLNCLCRSEGEHIRTAPAIVNRTQTRDYQYSTGGYYINDVVREGYNYGEKYDFLENKCGYHIFIKGFKVLRNLATRNIYYEDISMQIAPGKKVDLKDFEVTFLSSIGTYEKREPSKVCYYYGVNVISCNDYKLLTNTSPSANSVSTNTSNSINTNNNTAYIMDQLRDQGINAYTAKNYKEAFEVFSKLAKQNNSDGQYYLGRMYQDGEGVLKSVSEAIKWYNLAARGDNMSAVIALKRLAEEEKTTINRSNRAAPH